MFIIAEIGQQILRSQAVNTSRYCASAIAGDVVTVGSLGDFRVEKHVPGGLLASEESLNSVKAAVTPGGTLEACGTSYLTGLTTSTGLPGAPSAPTMSSSSSPPVAPPPISGFAATRQIQIYLK